MRIIFILMILIANVCLDASCKGCIQRRLEMLAQRPSLKEVFMNVHSQIDQLSDVPNDYHQNRYAKLFPTLDKAIEKEKNHPKIKFLLDRRKNHTERSTRYLYARSVLDTFMYIPGPLESLRIQRNDKLAKILASHPEHYTAPMLQHVVEIYPNSEVFAHLCKMCEKGHPIDQKFALYLHFYNQQVMHELDIQPITAACQALAIDLKRLSELQMTGIDNLIFKLAQLMQWESLLQKIGQSSYKLEDSTELAIATAQQEYMKSRRDYIRQHRELSVYR